MAVTVTAIALLCFVGLILLAFIARYAGRILVGYTDAICFKGDSDCEEGAYVAGMVLGAITYVCIILSLGLTILFAIVPPK